MRDPPFATSVWTSTGVPEQDAGKVLGALNAYRERLVAKQGNDKVPLRVFSLPCELVV